MSQYKYPEFILALSRETFLQIGIREGFNPQFNFEEFLTLVQSGVVIRQRNHLDEYRPWGESHKGDRDYSQWLNYFVVENYDDTINPYMRSREGNGESDLQGRGSIGVGGHTDFVDIVAHKSVIDLRQTVLHNVVREFFEECAVYVNGIRVGLSGDVATDLQIFANIATLHFEGIIFDNSDPVGRLHFAMALRIKLKEGVTVSSGEEVIDFVPPVRIQDIGATYPNVTFESWSLLFAFHLCNADAPNPKYDLLRYLPGHVV
jgi:predicted NUDIX family phosphoesterase